jgi:hypothetical protein
MKASSLQEIKKELNTLEPEAMKELCMRLAKYKKENKEMMSYLLFEANNEEAYIASIKDEVELLFGEIPKGINTYYIKKSLRKILRIVNKQIKYSGIKSTELELRIFFCKQVKHSRIPLSQGTVLYNLYQQQVKKIISIHSKLPEDLQYDYQRDINSL